MYRHTHTHTDTHTCTVFFDLTNSTSHNNLLLATKYKHFFIYLVCGFFTVCFQLLFKKLLKSLLYTLWLPNLSLHYQPYLWKLYFDKEQTEREREREREGGRGCGPCLELFLKLMFGLSFYLSLTKLFCYQSVCLKDHCQYVHFLCYPHAVVTGTLFLCILVDL